MGERRRAPRYRCRLRAEIRHAGRRHDASLLDVSLSGLSIQTAVALAQGEPVDVAIEGQVRVKALAWHAHRVKRPGPPSYLIGMMLSEVGPEYESLVARVAGRRAVPPRPADAAAPAAPPGVAAAQEQAAPAVTAAREARSAAAPAAPRCGAPPLPARPRHWWRLRIKQSQGTRSRLVTLAAATRDEAVAASLAEAGEGWEVVEVVKAS